MKKYLYVFLVHNLFFNSNYGLSFQEHKLPSLVKDLIKQHREACCQNKQPDGKNLEYTIGSGISYVNYLNHDIDYIVYSSENEHCRINDDADYVASFYQGSGGHQIQIFAKFVDQWRKIFNSVVFGYTLVSPTASDIPANIVTYIKGTPGYRVNRAEYEWNIKENKYVQKNLEENIYNQK